MLPKESVFKLQLLPHISATAISEAATTYPNALYLGNGPIYMTDGRPNGLVISEGKILSQLSCHTFRENSGNLSKTNSVFVKYRPVRSTEWRYRVMARESLCRIQSKSEEDLRDLSQINFAIQSGPGVLVDGQNLLKGYNGGTDFRSYIGVQNDGSPVLVEADGVVGSYCVGEFVRLRGVRDLLHRDSAVSAALFRETNGKFSTYPSAPNLRARTASVLIVLPH